MKPLFYTLAYIPGALALIGLAWGGAWLWTVPLFIFGLVPLVEVFLKGSSYNVSDAVARNRKEQRIFNALVYGIVPLHVAALALLLWNVSLGLYTGWEWCGATFTVGICCGMYGLNVGHEVGHRSGRTGKYSALLLMGSSLYPHFLLEHNRGHHRRVATPEDPASAQQGEWVYAFWVRSVVGGLRSAWGIDKGHVLRVWSGTLLVWCAVALGLGWMAALTWIAAGVIGIALLETVNYVEHYGLLRQKRPNGKYERTRPCHSWNANHPLGRALLFDLTRHSDHHAYPGRRYQVLRSHAEAPLLPSGYPGMILLSLLPPIFFQIMHPHIQREQQRLAHLKPAA